MTDTIAATGTPTEAVAADTDDLERFVDRARAHAASLDDLAERVAEARSLVVGSVGAVPIPAATLDDLVASAGEATAFVHSVWMALVDGSGPQARAAPVDGSGPLARALAEDGPAPGEETDPLVSAGVLPDGRHGPLAYPLYLGSQASLAVWTSSEWMVRARKQTFHPRDAAGRYVGAAAHPRRSWLALAGADRNWNPKPGQAAAVDRWRTAGRWAGRVGTAAVLVGSGWAEWQALAADPTLSTADRVGQTAAVAASTTAGSWGGVWLGTQAGVAIGTAICPGAGTVIGAFVGGFIGGVAGGQLGNMAGQEIKGVAGDLADGAVDLVEDLGDVGGAALDAVTFWD